MGSSVDRAIGRLLAEGEVHVTWSGVAGDAAAPVVTVTLSRPAARNAQTPAMWRALAAIGAELPPQTRVVVLKGAGPTFSAGIDLAMLGAEGIPGEIAVRDIAKLGDEQAHSLISQYQSAFTWWSDRSDVITIAAVQGAAVGAGFQLALACDLRVCADDARFAMKETSLGLVPDLAGSKPLVTILGYQRALEVAVTGRWIAAQEAVRLGLALLTVPAADLKSSVDDLVSAILAAPVQSVRATKGLLQHAVGAEVVRQRELERSTQIELIRALVGPAT